MKKLAILTALQLLFLLGFGQVQQGFKYQAEVRNAEGIPLVDQPLNLRITLESTTGGNTYYTEVHELTTNKFGLISIVIGEGSVTYGALFEVPWEEGDVTLHAEIKLDGAPNFSTLGQSVLYPVPYALYAASGQQGPEGPMGPQGEQGLPGETGPVGPAGTGLNNQGAWVSGTTYEPGDYVFAASSSNPLVNSMWIVQVQTAFISTLLPSQEPDNWVEFEAPQGEQGANGVGIVSTTDNGDGTFTLIYTDGTTFTTNDLTGPEGPLVPGNTGQTLNHDGTGWVANSNIFNANANVGIGTVNPTEKLEVMGNIKAHGKLIGENIEINQPSPFEEPIFVVRNSLGKIVFAVYESGIRMYVDDTSKGNRGGFAIGGFSDQTKETGKEYFRVTPDSVRVSIRNQQQGKGNRGGFAIGGFSDQTKKSSKDLLFIAPDSARIYINESSTKGNRGGFAVGGYSDQTKSEGQKYLFVGQDSARVYVKDSPTKGNRGGFAVGGFSDQTKQGSSNFLDLTPDNYFIGHNAGKEITSGIYNQFMGYNAGQANTTGSSNVFIGNSSGLKNTSGGSNVFIGNEAGGTNVSGQYNVFLGYNSGYSNTHSYNTFVGYRAGAVNTSGQYNAFMGYNAGQANTTASSNVFIGNQAGFTNTTGASNVFLGNLAGYANNASNNVFIGNESGRYNTSGTNNTFMGYYAGKANTTGNNNVFLGNESGTSNTSGSSNIAIGYNASRNNKTGYNNISLGQAAGYSGTNLHHNVFIGDSTGYATVSPNAYKNVFIGYAAGRNNNSNNNIYLGDLAGYSCVTGQNNIAIGSKAGYKNTGSQNIFIGTEAGLNNTTGFFNIILGRWAGHKITTGFQQIIIGGGAGASLTTGAENVIIGTNAGANNDGNKNIFIGNSAGWSNTGSNNIIMGYKVGYSYFQTVSNRLIIDNSQVATPLIWGEFDNRRLAINATNPTQTLDVNGTVRVRSIGSGAYSTVVNRTSDGTFTTATSDVRLKENISTLSGSLAKVMTLRGVNFTWKSEPAMGNRIGFIAQEVEKVVPELVFTNPEDGYMGVNYAEMTAVLVEALKEQQKEIETLKAEIEAIKALINK